MKTTLAFCFVCLWAFPIFANSIGKTNFLVESGLFKNFEQIRSLSDSLMDDERYKIFESQKSKVFWPIILNALTVPGIGSAVQKDYIGAPVSGVGYLTGWALFLYSTSLDSPTASVGVYYGNTALYEKDHDAYESKRHAYRYTGLALLGSSWLFGIARPLFFASRYNNKLGEALNFTSRTSFYIVPKTRYSALSLAVFRSF